MLLLAGDLPRKDSLCRGKSQICAPEWLGGRCDSTVLSQIGHRRQAIANATAVRMAAPLRECHIGRACALLSPIYGVTRRRAQP